MSDKAKSIPKAKRKSNLPREAFATAKRDYKRFAAYLKSLPNPDRVLTTTQDGIQKGIELFVEMKQDTHIKDCLRRLILKIVTYPWSVTDPVNEDQAVAEFIETEIRKYYYDLVTSILDAMPIGYSVTEFWCRVEESVRLAGIKKRRPDRFLFSPEGELLMKTLGSFDGESVPDQFIVATFDEEDDNPYGQGLMSSCFWPWWMKKNVILFWASYLERFGSPMALGTYPTGTDQKEVDNFLDSLEAIQSDFAAVVPESFNVEFVKGIEAAATDSYEKFEARMDRKISQAILSSHATDGSEKYGSKSANETLKDISDEIIAAAAEFAAKIINQQLIPRLCDWNFDLQEYPVFAIHHESKQVTKEEAETLKVLSDMGCPIPVEHVYEAQGWTIPGDDVLVLYEGRMIPYGEVKSRPANSGVQPRIAEFAEKEDLGEMVKKEEQYIDRVWLGFYPQLKAAYDIDGLIELAAGARDFNQAIRRLEKYNPKGIADSWAAVMRLGGALGEYSAFNQAAAMFAEVDVDDLWSKLDLEEAIRFIKGKIPVQKDVWDTLEQSSKNAAFYVSGVSRLIEINAVKEKMLDALEQGKTFEQFSRELRAQTGVEDFFSHMETAFYTNIHQSLSMQEFQALDRIKKMVPYREYWAVMDGKTRPEHAAAHGTVARHDDPIWNSLYPLLMDFNCRCRITAASEDDYNQRGDPEAEALRMAEGKFDPGVMSQNIEGLKSTLQENLSWKQKYSEYLDSAIRSWIGLSRPPLEMIGNLPPAPASVVTGKNADYYWQELGAALGQSGGEYSVKLPKIGTQKITRESLEHILGKGDREANFALIGEGLKNPFEIWEVTRDGRTITERVIALFSTDTGISAGIIVFQDGEFYTFIPSTSASRINGMRKGRFVYGR